MDDKKLEAQKLLNALDPDRLTKADFLKFGRGILAAMEQREKRFAKSFSDLAEAITKRLTQAGDEKFAEIDQRVNAKLASLRQPKDGEIGPKGEKGDAGEPGEAGTPGADGSPDMAEDIRNKLELLTDDERLKPEAIRGLVERLADLEKRIGERATVYTQGGVIGRNYLQFYDLSSKLNGASTTFALPAVYRIINVQLSSTPNVLREGVDYSWTPTSITFIGIDPTTQLSAGQTCVIVYVA
jgi:hypothetical protein